MSRSVATLPTTWRTGCRWWTTDSVVMIGSILSASIGHAAPCLFATSDWMDRRRTDRLAIYPRWGQITGTSASALRKKCADHPKGGSRGLLWGNSLLFMSTVPGNRGGVGLTRLRGLSLGNGGSQIGVTWCDHRVVIWQIPARPVLIW